MARFESPTTAMPHFSPIAISLLLVAGLSCPGLGEETASIAISPTRVLLDGPDAVHQLLVTSRSNIGTQSDLTRQATYRSMAPGIVEVSPNGVIHGVSDGAGSVEVKIGKQVKRVAVQVRGAKAPRSYNFERDIVPLMSRFACNASGCHGKAEGQNGFKLSVFGFDPMADYVALTREGRGRRVVPTLPASSLLLTKASGGVPHGGGVRIRRGSGDYRRLHDWIAGGMPFGNDNDPKVVSIELTPGERQVDMKSRHQLRVVATFSDGRTADVTGHAKFQSNNEGLGNVDEFGLVTVGEAPGEVAVMANYMGAVGVFQAMIPSANRLASFPKLPEANFIDTLVHQKLKKLHILPSAGTDDATFLRRVSLDIIGRLPTSEESRKFLEDKNGDRRARLVDRLLKRPEYADYWALKWSDLLRVDRLKLGHEPAYNYYRWIRDRFAENTPIDKFTRKLLTASGPVRENPQAIFYKSIGKPGDRAAVISQVFLGMRIDCAQCHHHPYDRWGQTDYWGMQAFFTQVGFKAGPTGESIRAAGNPQTKHPRTGQLIYAHALETGMPDAHPEGDRRTVLAKWMTGPKNRYFARNIANRVWAHLLGRGLVEPVDDVRLTNPPSNPELLDALADHLVASRFDLHALIRTVTASNAYQRSTVSNETNRGDEQNYSRFLLKRIDAEVLLDAISDTTGVPEKFQGTPAGFRAVQLWDSQVPHYFLKLFGRPYRVSACACERAGEPTVGQILHVMNSPQIQRKIAHAGGRIAKLVRESTDDDYVVEELYLTFFNRFPETSERKTALAHFRQVQAQKQTRAQAAEDLAWSMLNSLEFLFNH